jgi:hypothetical protein
MAERTQTDALNADSSLFRGTAELEDLKRRRFPAEGKSERIARALAAVRENGHIALSAKEWQFFAQDSDLEDQ